MFILGNEGRDPHHIQGRHIFIGGLFTLPKILYGMVFFNIKVNACILIHPIRNYNNLGEII